MKFEEYINESSLSRIWQFVEDNISFGIISAYRSYYDIKENKKRHIELKSNVRNKGYGYIEMKGGYVETIDGNKIEVEEDSLFIPKISKNDIIKFGNKFEQDSIIFKEGDIFYEIGTNDTKGVSKVLNKYKSTGDNMSLAKKVIKKFYSKLKKGSHKDKKFILKERHDTGMSQVYHQKIDNIWINLM